jgi:hypothetical protein
LAGADTSQDSFFTVTVLPKNQVPEIMIWGNIAQAGKNVGASARVTMYKGRGLQTIEFADVSPGPGFAEELSQSVIIRFL